MANVSISIALQSIYIAIITLVSFNLGNDFGDTAFASTFAFAVLGLSQMLHCFNCKFEGRIRFKKLFSNSFMNYSVIITTFIIIFLVLTPAGALFGLETLNFLQFIICLGISFTIIPFTELVKAITKKRWFAPPFWRDWSQFIKLTIESQWTQIRLPLYKGGFLVSNSLKVIGQKFGVVDFWQPAKQPLRQKSMIFATEESQKTCNKTLRYAQGDNSDYRWQIADARRQTVISADPYHVILSPAKNLKKLATRPFDTLRVTITNPELKIKHLI